MNDNREPSVDIYARKLTGDAYPRAEEFPDVPAFLRKWILRLGTSLPSDHALETAIRSFELSARRDIARAAGVSIELVQPLTSVTGVRLDEHHLVLEIVCPSSAAKLGDAAAIATWNTLRAADTQWQMEDLQGIPKTYWSFAR